MMKAAILISFAVSAGGFLVSWQVEDRRALSWLAAPAILTSLGGFALALVLCVIKALAF